MKGLIAYGGAVYMGWLSIPAAMALVVVGVILSTLWEGAKPEFRSFGADAAALLLGAARRVLRIPRR